MNTNKIHVVPARNAFLTAASDDNAQRPRCADGQPIRPHNVVTKGGYARRQQAQAPGIQPTASSCPGRLMAGTNWPCGAVAEHSRRAQRAAKRGCRDGS